MNSAEVRLALRACSPQHVGEEGHNHDRKAFRSYCSDPDRFRSRVRLYIDL
jgi:hypothetical protein